MVATPHLILFSSKRPIEPHVDLPTPEFKRWQWPRLLLAMVDPLGLPSGVERKNIPTKCRNVSPPRDPIVLHIDLGYGLDGVSFQVLRPREQSS